ncbi:S8 family serine peptidase [Paucibacter sp. PLA-PC-4]|uniref:S8 family peptidase n=1 Tax=Paucibacter sp. PLA-PC-4 TaxID=2993655 RepID=UPI002249347E|nr:S8 family serine peptidase [Paucibacter sp. PLA-PC-4]MCX2862718.1 S8 family serine peptidase [Paucibacter sp. PLA-PC-4]
MKHTPSHLSLSRLSVILIAALAAQQALAITTYEGDPGLLGDPASWRTAEFRRDWGLNAIGAEYAYAAGFSGAGIKVGMVDSGYFTAHPQLDSTRYHAVTVNGISGAWSSSYNDTHGTHVSGTIAASRDGSLGGSSNFHGVAFNASLYVGNTHKTDSVLFGMPQVTQTAAQTLEQGYVADVYRGVNAQGVRIISTSWGSQPNSEQYNTLGPNAAGTPGLLGAWGFLSRDDTWMKGALDAGKTGTVMVFSAGNTGFSNASARSGAAYFMPELEANWLAVAAIRQNLNISGSPVGQTLNADGSVNVPGAHLYNQCGVAKWSCMTAPGNGINGSTVNAAGVAGYSSLSGTSMAAPHASGALAVIMERYSYMTNAQALEVMKTTAVQNGTINNAAGVAIANTNAGQRTVVPDSRNGWGTISLRNAMNGPGQFLGKFAVNTQGQNDTWSNNISDTAIKARKLEDEAEASSWFNTKQSKGWLNGLPAGASADEVTEYTVGQAREVARDSRVYEGSLSKSGGGTLVLAGDNSYSGGTELFGGTLVGRSVSAFGSGDVTVHGGMLAGTATIQGDLLNEAGHIAPGEDSIGTLTVLGNFAQFPSGWLDLEIGAGGTDLLAIGGTAFLGGSLQLTLLDSFSLSGNASFTLMSAGNFMGQFSSVQVSGLGAGYTSALFYDNGSVRLDISAVPEPESYALMLAGLGLLSWQLRRRRGPQA